MSHTPHYNNHDCYAPTLDETSGWLESLIVLLFLSLGWSAISEMPFTKHNIHNFITFLYFNILLSCQGCLSDLGQKWARVNSNGKTLVLFKKHFQYILYGKLILIKSKNCPISVPFWPILCSNLASV